VTAGGERGDVPSKREGTKIGVDMGVTKRIKEGEITPEMKSRFRLISASNSYIQKHTTIFSLFFDTRKGVEVGVRVLLFCPVATQN